MTLFHYTVCSLAQTLDLLLLSRALEDTKLRSIENARSLEICHGLENQLFKEFDDMLWKLMTNAADKTHVSLEPMFSILDPNLPGFHPLEEDEDDLYKMQNGSYVKTPSKKEMREATDGGGFISKLLNRMSSGVDEEKAKGESYCVTSVN